MKPCSSLVFFIGLFCSFSSYAECDNADIVETSPQGRYILTSGLVDSVLDTRTGLRWRRCPVVDSGFNIIDPDSSVQFDESCDTDDAIKITWNDALNIAQDQVVSGESWRLPNLKELMSLIGDECTNPAVPEAPFPGIPDLESTAIDSDVDTFVDDIRIDLATNVDDEPSAAENTLLQTLTRVVWTSTPHILQDGSGNALEEHKSWAVDLNTGRLIALRRDSKAYVYVVR